MVTPVSASEQLMYATVRICGTLPSGGQSVGTGFLFSLPVDEQRQILFIVTNKHVITGTLEGSIAFHKASANDNASPGPDSLTVTVPDFEKRWIPHPDPDVDLCGTPFVPIIEQAASTGQKLYFRTFDPNIILNEDQLKELQAVEEILMVGYPIGLYDHVHNYPLFRRGITSSHPAVDFAGKSLFVIDAAVFPGSSGSPVLLLNEGAYTTKQGGMVIGQRMAFLGVLFAGPQFNAQGRIEIEQIPTSASATINTKVMVNLGFVIKAREVLTLAEHIKKTLGVTAPSKASVP